MGEVSRALGLGEPIEFRGKTYTISPWNYGIQAAFEQWLEQQAFRAVERSKGYLRPEEVQENRSALVRDIAAGVYSFGSETVAKATKELPGLKELVFLLIHENDQNFTRQLAGEMVESELLTIMEKINLATSDPTKPAIAPATLSA